MKRIYKLYILTAILIFSLATSCNHPLDEQPRSVLVPDYFKTGAGLQAGVTAAYATFRRYYGNEGGMNLTVYGTDEYTAGSGVANPPFNTYSSKLNSIQGDMGAAWDNAYKAINTCNGVIDLGPEANDLDDTQKNALIAEAKFIRAQWYFILVQYFGGVSIDLGSGDLKFNTSTSNNASRATLAETYKVIVDDLVSITDGGDDDLPDAKPSDAEAGHAWKASALHLLSKVYLTRGWSDAAETNDFQMAYNTAMELINNHSTYGVELLPDYADVHAEGNEWSSETLWMVNWIDNTTFNDNNAWSDPGYQNKSLFFFRCFYESNTAGLKRDITNGRPWMRYCPTAYLTNVAFADKVNDTRFNKSYQTVWYVNDPGKNNPKGLELGDTAMWMVPDHLASTVEPTIDSRRYIVFTPTTSTDPVTYFGEDGATYTDYDGYNKQNKYFPSIRKFNSTQPRPNNDANRTSVRPFIVYRFAETYLIAAEAALMMNKPNSEVADLINVVRKRAAAGGGDEAAVTATTETDLAANGIDYILDERTRELAGEQVRWFDLARTKKLIERVKKYNNYPPRPDAEYAAENIDQHHRLRPIPQTQIDASVDPSTSDGKYPQNPGY